MVGNIDISNTLTQKGHGQEKIGLAQPVGL